jgi:hypothetical protein
MGKQTFDRIKKTISVLLAVLFVVTLTASAGAACEESNSNTIPGLSDLDLGNFGSGLGFDQGDIGFDFGDLGFDQGDLGFDFGDLGFDFGSLE